MNDYSLQGYSLAKGFPENRSIFWELKKSDEIFRLVYGKALVASAREDGDIPVYGTNGQCGWHSSSIFSGPGVILGRKGQGHLGVEFCPGDYWVIDTAYSLELLENSSLRYCYYLIKYVGLNHLKDGTSNPTLSRDSFGRQLFPLPPLRDQELIAEILANLDAKIEINQKTNETLQDIGLTLFNSWFVDFDPVRAKSEGLPTGLPDEISCLFSDSLIESELGEIPEGWTLSRLGEFIFEVGQRTKPSSDTRENPYVPIDCISSKSLTLWEHKNGEEAKSSLVRFKRGDILFGAMRPYFHKVCVAPFEGTTRSTCLVLKSKNEDYFAYSLFTLFFDTTIDFATQNSSGSTIPYIKWGNELDNLKVALPPSELASRFNSLLEPVIQKFLLGIENQRVLSRIRDLLLPRLLTGAMRVRDAEKMLEEAGV